MDLTDKLLHVPCTRTMLEGWHPEVLFEGSVRAIVIGPASDQEAALQADMDTDMELDDDPEAPDLSTYWYGNAWSILLIDPTHCLEDGDRTIAHTGELAFDLERADCKDRVKRVLASLHGLNPEVVRVDASMVSDEQCLVSIGDLRTTNDMLIDMDKPIGSASIVDLALAAVARKMLRA